MITNLIASVIVTLVTNVTESSNGSGCNHGPNVLLNANMQSQWHVCSPYVPATERSITTDVRETTTLHFEYGLKPYDLVIADKFVSSVTRTLRLKSEWLESGVRTNGEPQFITATNLWNGPGAVIFSTVVTTNSNLSDVVIQ